VRGEPSGARSAPTPAGGFDVLLSGSVFLDLIFTGVPHPPASGTEVWASGLGSSPGGIANLAVALRRLHLSTSLAAAFGEDVYGDFCWRTLAEQEGVDLSRSRTFAGWHSPVTVSVSVDDDRSMITHGHPSLATADELIGDPPPVRACFGDLDQHSEQWLNRCRAQGALVFGDIGWDPSEQWAPETLKLLDGYDVFLPNEVEAMSYTRTATPRQAARELAELVPVVVVTRGGDGAIAIDARTGEEADAPGLGIDALDPTGAGDVFAAGFVYGTLAGWPLQQRLCLANLCAALSVRHFGGSLSAPGWCEIAQWWREQDDQQHEHFCDYAFLDEVLRDHSCSNVHRARATIGLRDVP
jgi:sugar/nucleoside kinase (ribokinase family)